MFNMLVEKCFTINVTLSNVYILVFVIDAWSISYIEFVQQSLEAHMLQLLTSLLKH